MLRKLAGIPPLACTIIALVLALDSILRAMYAEAAFAVFLGGSMLFVAWMIAKAER